MSRCKMGGAIRAFTPVFAGYAKPIDGFRGEIGQVSDVATLPVLRA
jgi:hypothetical protein